MQMQTAGALAAGGRSGRRRAQRAPARCGGDRTSGIGRAASSPPAAADTTGARTFISGPAETKGDESDEEDSSHERVPAKRPVSNTAAAAAAAPLLEAGAASQPLLQVAPSDLQLPPGAVSGVRGGGVIVGAATADGAGLDPSLSGMGYLKRILTSRVYEAAVETPMIVMEQLSDRVGNKVLLKREDLQPVKSFKLRGAYNRMAELTEEELARGVICSSAGNHAQGVAYSAQQLGADAVIAMPVTTPRIKVDSVKRLGGTVALVGDTYDATQAYAMQRARDEGRIFIPPFDDPAVIAGQGTTGIEILRDVGKLLGRGEVPHAVFVPVGGGGLIAGIASYIKRLAPEVRIIGVEPAGANAMAQSLQRGRLVELSKVDPFADGVAVRKVGAECFRICQELLDGVVLVGNNEISAAIKDVFTETRSILEPAGALSLAGAKAYLEYHDMEGEAVVAISSGANMNFNRLRQVSEMADVGNRREAVLGTVIPEERGAFKKFVSMLGALNITEFKYRQGASQDARVFYRVNYSGADVIEELCDRMRTENMPTYDLTEDQITEMHLSQMIGSSATVANERVFTFNFPERPGALALFLDTFSPKWNITTFHYRASGEAAGRVMVGFEVCDDTREEFFAAVDKLGFDYEETTDNLTFRMFLQASGTWDSVA